MDTEMSIETTEAMAYIRGYEPCPFCGSRREPTEMEDGALCCTACGARGPIPLDPDDKIYDSLELWNYREGEEEDSGQMSWYGTIKSMTDGYVFRCFGPSRSYDMLRREMEHFAETANLDIEY